MKFTSKLEPMLEELESIGKSNTLPPVTALFCSIAAYWIAESLRIYKEGR